MKSSKRARVPPGEGGVPGVPLGDSLGGSPGGGADWGVVSGAKSWRCVVVSGAKSWRCVGGDRMERDKIR